MKKQPKVRVTGFSETATIYLKRQDPDYYEVIYTSEGKEFKESGPYEEELIGHVVSLFLECGKPVVVSRVHE